MMLLCNGPILYIDITQVKCQLSQSLDFSLPTPDYQILLSSFLVSFILFAHQDPYIIEKYTYINSIYFKTIRNGVILNDIGQVHLH